MKPIKYFLFLFISALVVPVMAQVNIFKSAKTGTNAYLDWVNSDTLGNNYVIGRFNTSFEYDGITVTGNTLGEGANNIYVLKTSSVGKPYWLLSVRGFNTEDYVSFVNAASNNNGETVLVISASFLAGIYIGERPVELNPNDASQLIIKFGKNGLVHWIRPLNTTGTKGGAYIKDIKINEAGEVYVAGYFTGISLVQNSSELSGLNAYSRMFISKYTSKGDNAWTSSCDIVPSAIDTVGGIKATRMKLFSNGSVVVAGTMDGTRRFQIAGQQFYNQGITNSFIASFNSSGTALWAIPYNGDGYIEPNDIDINENGEIVFTCYYQSSALNVNGRTYNSFGDYDLIVAKYSIAGTLGWVNTIPINLSIPFENYTVEKAGFTSNGAVIVAGETYVGGIKCFFFKGYNNDLGNPLWSIQTSNVFGIYFDQIKLDRWGNVYFGGTTYSSFDLGTLSVANAETTPVTFFGKISNSGSTDYIYLKTLDTQNSNYLYFKKICPDNFGNLNLLGTFEGNSVALEGFSLSDNSKSGIFLAHYGPVVNVGGKVFNLLGEKITKGYVKLIGYSYLQKSPVIDSVAISSDGSYLFKEVPYGRYILLAIPENDATNNYFPTYFPSAYHWEEAEKIDILSPVNLTSLYISVPKIPVLAGDAKLEGIVTEVEEDDIFKSTMDKPSQKAKAKLMKTGGKSDYEIVAETETDDLGNFSFNQVEDGDYFIVIEVEGLPVIDPYNINVSGGEYISNLDYLVGEESITTNGTPTGKKENRGSSSSSVRLYPNPCRGDVTIVVNNLHSSCNVVITDLQGRKIKEFNSVSENLNIDGLDEGVYLVTIDSEKGIQTVKLIVKP
jgi:hypothetical protein